MFENNFSIILIYEKSSANTKWLGLLHSGTMITNINQMKT